MDVLASSSSSEEEEAVLGAVLSAVEAVTQNAPTVHGWSGSLKGRRANLHRGDCSWWRDLLSENPIYRPWQFRRRFRVHLKLFRRLLHELPLIEPLLCQRLDALGRPGATSWQKILNSLRPLGDGVSFQALDYQCRMSVESQRQAFKAFVRAVRAVRACYGTEFLNRAPTLAELRALEASFAAKLFPGCVGTVDCMNISWKNCPKAWKGWYHNPKNGKLATVSVEALCDANLYCWHVFCGRPGTNNDITVAASSRFLMDILSGRRRMKLPEGYVVDGTRRYWFLYYLTVGIYPERSIFVRPNHAQLTVKEKVMTNAQEGRRKNVERLFGVLQGRFHILRHEFHLWSDRELVEIVQTCVILHNMLVSLRLSGELDDGLDDHGELLHPEEVVEEFFYAAGVGESDGDDEDVVDSNGAGGSTAEGWLQYLFSVDEEIRNRSADRTRRETLKDHIWSRADDGML